MEGPRLGVESELQQQANAMATAIPDPSHIFDLRCSLQQHRILNATEGGLESNPYAHRH